MARLLLIDDDEALRGVLAKSLHYAGHEVLQAGDGQQGLDLVEATSVDLVITDLIMPVQEGVETIVRLKRTHSHVPIIAISGGSSNAPLYLEIANKIGAHRILEKPFTPEDLIGLIETVLREQTAR